MADIKPKTARVRQACVADIAKMVATVERQKLELMDLEERIETNTENIKASLERIEYLEKELVKLDA